MTKLQIADIADLRAYEREREEFRRRIIALKKVRRVGVGPFVTLLFENRDTIRFQIQEMARVERLMTDEAIAAELRIYNPLVPDVGNLAATLFVELVNDDELRTWLPKLVGIERAVAFRLGKQGETEVVRCLVDADHEKQLTRDETTASVHYVHVAFTPAQIDRFETGPVTLLLDHPEYRHESELTAETRTELLTDLRPVAAG